MSHLWASGSNGILALLSTQNGGVVALSPTIGNPKWQIVRTFPRRIGYGYFASATGSSNIYLSLPGDFNGDFRYFISQNGGLSWASYSFQGVTVAPITSAGPSLFTLGRAGGFSSSNDGGKTWATHNNGITSNIQGSWFSSSLNNFVLATDTAIFTSPSGSFSQSSSRPNPGLSFLLESGAGKNAFFAGVDSFGNISTSPVWSATWTTRPGPDVRISRLTGYRSSGLAFAPDQNVWVLAIQTQQPFSQLPVFYYSTGNGPWSLAAAPLNIMDVASTGALAYANGAFVAVVSENLNGVRVLTSTNGSVWLPSKLSVKVNVNVPSSSLYVAGPPGKQYFFLTFVDGRIPTYFSADGVNWKQFNTPVDGPATISWLPGPQKWLAYGSFHYATSSDLANWSDPFYSPYPSTIFDQFSGSPSGVTVGVSSWDNTIITTNFSF